MFIKAQGVAGQHSYLASIKSGRLATSVFRPDYPPESRYRWYVLALPICGTSRHFAATQ